MKAGGTSGNGKERLRDYSVSRPEIPQRTPNREAIKEKSSRGAKRDLTGYTAKSGKTCGLRNTPGTAIPSDNPAGSLCSLLFFIFRNLRQASYSEHGSARFCKAVRKWERARPAFLVLRRIPKTGLRQRTVLVLFTIDRAKNLAKYGLQRAGSNFGGFVKKSL